MKKLFALLLALVMVFSLATVAMAAGSVTIGDETYPDEPTATFHKYYALENDGTTSPAETFTFTLTPESVTMADDGVTVGNMPVFTVGTADYEEGDAVVGTTELPGALSAVVMNLPECFDGEGEPVMENGRYTTFPSVGVYTYTITEDVPDPKTAGVDYHTDPIKLVVTVAYDEEGSGKLRITAIHTEKDEEDGKSDGIINTYQAGGLSVTKVVDGAFGQKDKEFDFTVEFTKPVGTDVKSDITVSYDGGETSEEIELTWGEDGKATYEFTLKDDQTILFENIPYGVTYEVVEEDYSGEDYVTEYDDNKSGTIDSASVETTVTNTKGGNIDTGITLDSLPYILILVVAAVGLVLFLVKRRASAED